MTAPASGRLAGGGVGGIALGATRPTAAALPPNPKIQAVTFALELAKVKATAAVPGKRETTVDQLINDAKAINAFIGAS